MGFPWNIIYRVLFLLSQHDPGLPLVIYIIRPQWVNRQSQTTPTGVAGYDLSYIMQDPAVFASFMMYWYMNPCVLLCDMGGLIMSFNNAKPESEHGLPAVFVTKELHCQTISKLLIKTLHLFSASLFTHGTELSCCSFLKNLGGSCTEKKCIF